MSANRRSTLVIAILGSSMLAGCAGSVSGADDGLSEEALSSNEHTAFNYFVSKGLTKAQSAGIVGNLIQESSVIPTSVQYGGGPGRGIAQWSVGGRWDSDRSDNVTWYANAHGENRWALSTQLNFTWYELETFSGYGLASLRADSSVSAATVTFQDRFEGCGTCDQSQRIKYAEEVLSAYGGSSGGAGCYSSTKGREMPDNACVQSRSNSLWYQCANGAWVDRWTDPAACNGVYPL